MVDSDAGELTVGTDREHAHIHQFDALIRPVWADHLVFHLGGETVLAHEVEDPAGPFLGLSSDDEREFSRSSRTSPGYSKDRPEGPMGAYFVLNMPVNDPVVIKHTTPGSMRSVFIRR